MIASDLASLDRLLAGHRSPCAVQRIVLGGRPIDVHTTDEHGARLVVDRFGHLTSPADGAATDHHRPHALRVRIATGDIAGATTARRGIHRFHDGGLAVIEPHHQYEVYRPGIGIDLVVSPAAWSDVEVTSYPLANTLTAWAISQGLRPVHAAAVEVDGRGVLLVGASGAGKSTTAVACAMAGSGLIGDDRCIIDPVTMSVHSWYGTVKYYDDSADALGVRHWERIGVNPIGKTVVDIARRGDIRMVRSVPLAAAVVLRPLGSDVQAGIPLPTARAVTALRPTTLPHLGALGAWLRDASAIARRIPVVEVALDRSLDAMVGAVDAASRLGEI